jgi:hypothetical protein
MHMTRCPICKGAVWSHNPPHVCPPLWEVCYPDLDDSRWIEVYAKTAEDAAVAYLSVSDAEHNSWKRYNGEEREVRVRKAGDEVDGYIYCVGLEIVPQYEARLIDSCPKCCHDYEDPQNPICRHPECEIGRQNLEDERGDALYHARKDDELLEAGR